MTFGAGSLLVHRRTGPIRAMAGPLPPAAWESALRRPNQGALQRAPYLAIGARNDIRDVESRLGIFLVPQSVEAINGIVISSQAR